MEKGNKEEEIFAGKKKARLGEEKVAGGSSGKKPYRPYV